MESIDKYVSRVYDYHVETTSECAARTYVLPDTTIVIGITSNDPYYLLHECGHAVFGIRDIVGLTYDDEEAFCYLLE